MNDKSPLTSKPSATTAPPTVNGQASAPAPAADKKKEKKDEHRDTLREIFETVVFVVVLVLLLKTFVAEAFVIPTGSMGPTLYGYQKIVQCDKCDYVFPVNCSSEVDPSDGIRRVVSGCTCPNCQNDITWKVDHPNTADARVVDGPDWNSGDRVLVAKFLYDRDRLWSARRGQVIVFKFPEGPQKNTTAMNYIKRCEGEPGETVAILNGDLYVTRALTYPHRQPSENPLDRWRKPNMYISDSEAIKLFQDSMMRAGAGHPAEGDFVIVRKPPAEMLAQRRIVFDNDNQPRDLAGAVRRWQWRENGRWSTDNPKTPKTFTHPAGTSGEATEWLTYNHLLRTNIDAINRILPENPPGGANDPRRLITNTVGFNTGKTDPSNWEPVGRTWVGDLMIDCVVKVASKQGEFILELSKGQDRFQAKFDLSSGICRLVRKTLPGNEDVELAQQPTPLKNTGTFKIRFANFDRRLTVWVDSKLPFGDGVEYRPLGRFGPTSENDLEPARIGSSARVEVSHLQLWRDNYYSLLEDRFDPSNDDDKREVRSVTIGDQKFPMQTFYVQPGHYMALGDNSTASLDSRYWGLVPDRLLLGRALVVYFPFWPFTQETRAGLIR